MLFLRPLRRLRPRQPLLQPGPPRLPPRPLLLPLPLSLPLRPLLGLQRLGLHPRGRCLAQTRAAPGGPRPEGATPHFQPPRLPVGEGRRQAGVSRGHQGGRGVQGREKEKETTMKKNSTVNIVKINGGLYFFPYSLEQVSG